MKNSDKNLRIGIIAPEAYRLLFALTSVELSFRESFPRASMEKVEQDALEKPAGLDKYDIVVLPPSQGMKSPYAYFLNSKAAENLHDYAQKGAIAAICSGAFAVTSEFTFAFPEKGTGLYRGYVPLIDVPAHGPVDYDFADRSDPNRFSDTRLMPVFSHASASPERLKLCYAAGPGYDAAQVRNRPDIRALSLFEDGGVSILAQKMGRGITIAFGALPEIQPAHMPSNLRPWISEMKADLERTEPARRILWDTAMEMLATRSLYPARSPQSKADCHAATL